MCCRHVRGTDVLWALHTPGGKLDGRWVVWGRGRRVRPPEWELGLRDKITSLWVPFPLCGLLPWLPVSYNCLAEGPGQPAGRSHPQPITMIP